MRHKVWAKTTIKGNHTMRFICLLCSICVIVAALFGCKPNPDRDATRSRTGGSGQSTDEISGATATETAAEIWADLIADDAARVEAGWRALAAADPTLLRRAEYHAYDAHNDQVRVGSLVFRFDTNALRSMEAAFTAAFAESAHEDVIRACIALDALGAGMMASSSRFRVWSTGVRPDAYNRAILVRLYALGKLAELEPDTGEVTRAKLERLHEIGRSGVIASDVP